MKPSPLGGPTGTEKRLMKTLLMVRFGNLVILVTGVNGVELFPTREDSVRIRHDLIPVRKEHFYSGVNRR